jgi:hypothetical protein
VLIASFPLTIKSLSRAGCCPSICGVARFRGGARRRAHLQVPVASQNLPTPHAVPAGSAATATQTGDPVAHETEPLMHGLVGWQACPAAHAPQVPAGEQTRLIPQAVPAGRLACATHTGTLVRQDIAPLWHGLAG